MTKSNEPIASPAARTAALAAALTDRDLLPDGLLDTVIKTATVEWNPRNGARVVARAWSDPAFKRRLLSDATAACAELGYSGLQGEYIVALEDTPERHNVIVCTQCSCTAWPILGLPPDWYKSPEYRARVVRAPRKVLRELGLDLDPAIAIRVWETSAETRYMVLPLRPAGTDGWSEEALAHLVTRETLVGIAMPETRSPA
jgi:nitrile hydratase